MIVAVGVAPVAAVERLEGVREVGGEHHEAGEVEAQREA